MCLQWCHMGFWWQQGWHVDFGWLAARGSEWAFTRYMGATSTLAGSTWVHVGFCLIQWCHVDFDWVQGCLVGSGHWWSIMQTGKLALSGQYIGPTRGPDPTWEPCELQLDHTCEPSGLQVDPTWEPSELHSSTSHGPHVQVVWTEGKANVVNK